MHVLFSALHETHEKPLSHKVSRYYPNLRLVSHSYSTLERTTTQHNVTSNLLLPPHNIPHIGDPIGPSPSSSHLHPIPSTKAFENPILSHRILSSANPYLRTHGNRIHSSSDFRRCSKPDELYGFILGREWCIRVLGWCMGEGEGREESRDWSY